MLQVRRDADLAQKPLDTEDGAELRIQDLERDESLVTEVPREEDCSHAPAPELPLNHVAAGECFVESGGVRVRHDSGSRRGGGGTTAKGRAEEPFRLAGRDTVARENG